MLYGPCESQGKEAGEMMGNVENRHRVPPKKKEKKQTRLQETRFLKKSCEWLKWRVPDRERFLFWIPCLEQ